MTGTPGRRQKNGLTSGVSDAFPRSPGLGQDDLTNEVLIMMKSEPTGAGSGHA